MDSENELPLCCVKRKSLFGYEKKIVDSQGHVSYTTNILNSAYCLEKNDCINNENYAIYENNMPIAFAITELECTDRKYIQKLPLPKINKMTIEIPGGVLKISRRNDNGVSIHYNERTVGEISPFFRLKPQTMTIDIPQIQNPSFFAALYTIISYMMHEDDLYLV